MNIFFIRLFVPSWSGDGSDGIAGSGSGNGGSGG